MLLTMPAYKKSISFELLVKVNPACQLLLHASLRWYKSIKGLLSDSMGYSGVILLLLSKYRHYKEGKFMILRGVGNLNVQCPWEAVFFLLIATCNWLCRKYVHTSPSKFVEVYFQIYASWLPSEANICFCFRPKVKPISSQKQIYIIKRKNTS